MLCLADGLLAGDGQYSAALDFLRKSAPRIRGHAAGTPIIDEAHAALPQIIEAVVNLDNSTLFIQGPPGAGKTYTGSHLIVELIARGCRVGVTSNSHKAIHNLLHTVEEQADQRGLQFGGLYKASVQTRGSAFDGKYIQCVADNKLIVYAADKPFTHLFAGTAWLFCDPRLEQKLDYLFVDEAGQVAAANLVAMATSARNIVLLGDQMQLGQPIQGVHPGESGLAEMLRVTLLEMQRLKLVNTGRNEKMEQLYNYLASPQFAQRVRTMLDSFEAMRRDLEAEKRAMQKIWVKRQGQIDA